MEGGALEGRSGTAGLEQSWRSWKETLDHILKRKASTSTGGSGLEHYSTAPSETVSNDTGQA